MTFLNSTLSEVFLFLKMRSLQSVLLHTKKKECRQVCIGETATQAQGRTVSIYHLSNDYDNAYTSLILSLSNDFISSWIIGGFPGL